MRSVVIPEEAHAFSESLTCRHCGTSFIAEASDLDYDGFKKPGTYEFAGTAEYEYHFFVQCPGACGHVIFVDAKNIGVLLKKELRSKAS